MGLKRFYVARGGRNMCVTTDYNQALLFSKNKPERVHEFANYNGALKLFKRIVDSAIEHSEKPTGDFIHLDVSVSLTNGMSEFRVMQGNRYLVSANSLGYCTPNIAEYIAIVEAYKYCINFGLEQPIYCDNIAAVKAFKREFVMNVPPTLNAANPKITEMLERANDYVNMLPEGYEEKVLYWDKSMWGEIPSDYKKKHTEHSSD